ncbi:MAG TPA: hypothetical protein VNB64_02930 [Solirubrobacteraceae bacterium]|nr:hypothetical protein [Solirubrobacteraceae bacterium]
MELRDVAEDRIAPTGPPRVRVHDNYIHHNRRYGRDGYGIAVKDGSFAWIERNVFDFNRHAIEGDGDPETGYVAYDNLVLRGGGEHRRFPIYGWDHTHQFDMHGTRTCGIGHLNCGVGGHHIDIRTLGCKRITLSDTYYRALTRVHLAALAAHAPPGPRRLRAAGRLTAVCGRLVGVSGPGRARAVFVAETALVK